MSSWLARLCLAAAVGAWARASPAGDGVEARLQAALEQVARANAQKYNCSISIGLRTASGRVAAAGGTVEVLGARPAAVTDTYPWGSVTKMLTASSIMKLISTGAFSLHDEIGPLVDPILASMGKRNPKQNFSSLRELWGEAAERTTVEQLLGMKSGIPDFDTAKPNMTGISLDPLRAMLYATPKRCDTPTELMSVSWVAHKFKECQRLPHFPSLFCYSSTNFMLLGLVLAAKAGKIDWRDFDQSAYLPESLRDEIRFANHGSPRDWGTVHGYDRTAYNVPKGQHNNHDDWEVEGVFSGWTASNLVATPSAVAELAWQIFGPPKGIAPKAFVDQMIPNRTSLYGLGAFNIGFQTGHKDALGVAYGHLGATYGYQSVVAYFPKLNVALAIATNIETDNQVQPSDTFCLSYNSVASILLGKKFECTFEPRGYYGGQCNCTESALEVIV